VPNTGGGGGGSVNGNGGSGIVIVSYPTPAVQQTGTTITIAPPASGSATHVINYWSVDYAGNVEAMNTATFTVAKVVPSVPVIASATTTASAWFTGAPPDDTNAAGRGAVTLSWSHVPLASSYNIYLFDGATYRQVDTTTATSWTSAGAGIYPTDTQIAAMSVGCTGDPYPGHTGRDLRDDPTPLYAKMAGATVSTIPAYFFKVTAANGTGETTLALEPTTTVQLANRTQRVNEAAAYTDYDLGSVAGDSASTHLNTGALVLSATDLSLASYGPPAELSRTYVSSCTTATDFAPGWRFNFESCVTSTPTGNMTYFDANSGDTSLMTRVDTYAWAAPHTMAATLTQDLGSGTYALTFADGSVTAFDASGRLASETDRRGDSVTYAWVSPGMVIKSANNQFLDDHEIDVTISGGQVTMATNTEGGLTREVDYATGSGSGSVTKHLDSAGTTAQITYSYNASSTISTVTVPGFASGNATWGLTYNGSGWLTNVVYPSATTRTVSITADPIGDTASVSRPARVGDLATSDTTVTENFAWDPTGRMIADSDPTAAGASCAGTATTEYAPSGQPRHSVTAAGVITDSVTDNDGNVLSSSDALGNTTTNVYDAYGDLMSTTDPKGAQTTYTYNTANGDMLTKSQQLNTTDWALTTWTYGGDTHGRAASMTQAITATQTAETDYTNYGDFTDPQDTVQRGVALSSTNMVNLTTQDTFDGFGDLLSVTDPSGVVTEQHTYDLSGRPISQTDATGTVTNAAYDVLGDEIETSQTAVGGAWANWTTATVDPTGLTLAETSLVTSAAAVVPASFVMHVYDGSGNEIATGISNEGTAATAYDAAGNVTAQWNPGADLTTVAAAQVTTSDADGNPIDVAAPAQVMGSNVQTANVITYAPGTDEVATQQVVGSAAATCSYDPNGDLTTVTVPVNSGGTTTTANAYDLGGRLVSSTDASGDVTTTTYDLLGRATSETLQGSGRTASVTYNSQGWVLSSTDASGVVTTYVYDKDGRVLTQTVGSGAGAQVTQNTYDALGDDTYTLNPDGSSIQRAFDAFGRQVAEVDTAASGEITHNLYAVLDQTGRIVSSSDSGTKGVNSAATYATSPSGTTLLTSAFGDATRTVITDATGLLTTQTLSVAGQTMSIAVVARTLAKQPEWWIYTSPNGGSDQELALYDVDGHVWADATSMDEWLSNYGYDSQTGLKNSEQLIAPAPGASPNGNVQQSSIAYTNQGRIASVVTTENGPNLPTEWGAATNFAYDGAGDITQDGSKTLSYSGAQLASSQVGTATTTYTFDGLGRRIAQVSAAASATYTWAQSADHLLSYTHRSRGTTDVVAAYSYDPSGQRTQSVVTSGSVTTTTTYLYEGTQLLRLAATSGSRTTTLTYLYGQDGRPEALAAEASGTVYFLHIATTDRGDVQFLTDLLPGGSEGGDTCIAAWGYDVWGDPLYAGYGGDSTVPTSVAQTIAAIQPLRYAGYCYDPYSGLYYCSQRYFDPATCQFLSKDPVNADGEQSPYQYGGGDPINHIDPTGTRMLFSDTSQVTQRDIVAAAYLRASAKRKAAMVSELRKLSAAQAVLMHKQELAETAAEKRHAEAKAKAAGIQETNNPTESLPFGVGFDLGTDTPLSSSGGQGLNPLTVITGTYTDSVVPEFGNRTAPLQILHDHSSVGCSLSRPILGGHASSNYRVGWPAAATAGFGYTGSANRDIQATGWTLDVTTSEFSSVKVRMSSVNQAGGGVYGTYCEYDLNAQKVGLEAAVGGELYNLVTALGGGLEIPAMAP
jgi:RHS repeat-associated protein